MGAALAIVTAEDLKRVLRLREGVTVDVVVWDPLRRVMTLCFVGDGVDVEYPFDGGEPEIVPIERLMTRFPMVAIPLGEPGYGEGEQTFVPKGEAAGDRVWHHGRDFPDPLLLHKLAEGSGAAAEGSEGRFEAATCPECGGGLVERVPLTLYGESDFRVGAGLRCVDCGNQEPVS
jgi:hypothetical protein